LALAGGPLAALVALSSLVLYVVVYTPLKRVTSANTLVGAVPGALPPVVGWAAAGDGLSIGAFALFAILYLWQLPHFLAIASLYRDDYAAAGMPMLPVVDRGGAVVGRQAVLYAAYLLVASIGPWWLGLAGGGYLVAAVGLGLCYLLASGLLLLAPSPRAARRVFACSLIYLAGAFAALWLDAIRGHCSNTGLADRVSVVRRLSSAPSVVPSDRVPVGVRTEPHAP
jgi:protoheme IX farnesyltransferase